MAGRYTREMARLADTFAWAATADIKPLCQAVHGAGLSPLRAIGSGGSLTGSHALVSLHRRYTGHLAAVSTPLHAIDEPLDATTSTWLLSASGSNVDIVAAARALIAREPRQLGVLCGHELSPLANLCRQHPFVDLLIYRPPSGKDGFLATNSLLGLTVLLTRSYVTAFRSQADWKEVANCLEPLISGSAAAWAPWQVATAPLWKRSTTLVLHGPSTRIGAIDLESKFTEAAIGHVQFADYRNFAHGRHHWLAKRSETSAVLAFITDADRLLAERTLKLLPTEVPQSRMEFSGGPTATGIASLLAALKITEWAGLARGIDPGRPGVPEFGRRLYRLSLPRRSTDRRLPTMTPRDAAAITRKAAAPLVYLASRGDLAHWQQALADFRSRLFGALFGGIVLDYDGTVVDMRRRSEPADEEMAGELTRLAATGVLVAFATGRGVSIRRDLQDRLPRNLWPHILVAYYNGAEVASLDNDEAPDGSSSTCAALRPISEALRLQPELAACAIQEDRPFQITLQPGRTMRLGRLWDLARQVVGRTATSQISISCSSHSIDIGAPGVSKLNAVRRIRETVGDTPILTIGDRGRWPGNDHELLCEPFALGVDEISADPETCWHLGEPGQRGPAVTLDYLGALEGNDGGLRFGAGSLQ